MKDIICYNQLTYKRLGLLLILVILVHRANAQNVPASPIPFEMMQGNEKFYSLLIVNRPLEEGEQLSFFNITTFSATHENEVARNEFFSSSMLSLPIYRNIKAASGINLNSVAGLHYFVGFQFSEVRGPWLIVLIPGIYFREGSSLETLALVEFRPPITQRFRLYSRIHSLYNAETVNLLHNRSYTYLRLGLNVARTSFGLGFNSDWYGPSKIYGENCGIFLRMEIP